MAEKKRAVAMGFFDGIHLGHAALLQKTRELAGELGLSPAVLTFDTHPDTLVFGKEVPLINSAEEREEIISRLFGIPETIFLRFNRKLMTMPWRDFIRSAVEELAIGAVVVGHDFSFGYRGEGKPQLLKEWCAENGIACEIVPAVYMDGRIISSTEIRSLLTEGRLEEANRMLGHPHQLLDTVHSGYHLGEKLGSPTINMLFPRGVVIPRHGVYATKVYIDSEEPKIAVTNIGVRPTVSDTGRVSVESHLLDFSGNLYGRKARVEFYYFQRPEQKFDDTASLAAQIQRDVEETRRRFSV